MREVRPRVLNPYPSLFLSALSFLDPVFLFLWPGEFGCVCFSSPRCVRPTRSMRLVVTAERKGERQRDKKGEGRRQGKGRDCPGGGGWRGGGGARLFSYGM